jgi:hypothetical protein
MVAKLTNPVFKRRGLASGAIVNDWPAIAGPYLAARSAPEKIVYPAGENSEGTLHLKTDSGGLATELQHLEPVLLERVNTYFGYRAVARLKLFQGPLKVRGREPPPLRSLHLAEEKDLLAHLLAVDDPNLRQALERLGRAVRARHDNGATDE